MANHIAIAQYLGEAKKRKYLKPAAHQDVCLADYINTANSILHHLREFGDGLDTDQLCDRTKLNINTVRIYCRELHKLGFLDRERNGTKVIIWRIK